MHTESIHPSAGVKSAPETTEARPHATEAKCDAMVRTLEGLPVETARRRLLCGIRAALLMLTTNLRVRAVAHSFVGIAVDEYLAIYENAGPADEMVLDAYELLSWLERLDFGQDEESRELRAVLWVAVAERDLGDAVLLIRRLVIRRAFDGPDFDEARNVPDAIACVAGYIEPGAANLEQRAG